MNQYDTHSALYDALYLGLKGEKEFYVSESLKIGGNILELGCGTGRITIPIAQSGLDIVGIDNSEGLLKEANEKVSKIKNLPGNVEFLYGDMRDFSLEKKFDLIIIPYRAFLHLHTPEDQKKTLRNIHNHLNENGKLIMNMFFPRIDVIDSSINTLGNAIKQVKTLENNGKKTIFYDSRTYSSYTQLIHQYFIAEELDENGIVTSKQYFPLTLRWVTKFEMEHLFELCNFKIENLYGWFDKRNLSDESEEMIWVVKKS
ncbi:MAG: class I SAM-dependent methyltransferase [Cyanobacteriota bacterium]